MILAGAIALVLVAAPGWQVMPRSAHGIQDRMTALDAPTNPAGEVEYLWVGTERGTFHRYDLRTDRWTTLAGPNQATGAFFDFDHDENYLWAGTSGGLFRFDRRTDAWDNDALPTAPQGPAVTRVGIDILNHGGSNLRFSNRYVWILSPKVAFSNGLFTAGSSPGILIHDQHFSETFSLTSASGLSELAPSDAILVGEELKIVGSVGLHTVSLADRSPLSRGSFFPGEKSRLSSLARGEGGLWAGGPGEAWFIADDGEQVHPARFKLSASPDANIIRILATADLTIFGSDGDGAFVRDATTGDWSVLPEEYSGRFIDDIVRLPDGFFISSSQAGGLPLLTRYWSEIPSLGPTTRERIIEGSASGAVRVKESLLEGNVLPLRQLIDEWDIPRLLARLRESLEMLSGDSAATTGVLDSECLTLLRRFLAYPERTIAEGAIREIRGTLDERGFLLESKEGLLILAANESTVVGNAAEEKRFTWPIHQAFFAPDGSLRWIR